MLALGVFFLFFCPVTSGRTCRRFTLRFLPWLSMSADVAVAFSLLLSSRQRRPCRDCVSRGKRGRRLGRKGPLMRCSRRARRWSGESLVARLPVRFFSFSRSCCRIVVSISGPLLSAKHRRWIGATHFLSPTCWAISERSPLRCFCSQSTPVAISISDVVVVA